MAGLMAERPPRSHPALDRLRGKLMASEVRNVLLIISDTLRRDCVSVYGEPGWFGRPLDTPHLERFAQRATVFDRAYSSSFPPAPEWLERNPGDPFFLYVDTFDPPEPWTPPRD